MAVGCSAANPVWVLTPELVHAVWPLGRLNNTWESFMEPAATISRPERVTSAA